MAETPFIVACFFAIIMLILPAAWHIRARNASTLLYIFWSLVGNVIYFVNSLVWRGNIRNPAPVWCDISTKLVVGLSVGLPSASLCIQRRLYNASRLSTASGSASDRSRQTAIDLAIGLGIPALVMIVHYVVQGHRYDIFEDFGCWPTLYPTAIAIPLVLMWPLLMSTISIPYCVASYISFTRRRVEFQRYLAASSSTGLNTDRYMRLMALASTELVIVLPLNILSISSNLSHGLQPWVSWAHVHADWMRVSYFTRWMYTRNKKWYIEFSVARWAIPISGILFFLFFGLASEARKDYACAFDLLLRLFGVRSTRYDGSSSSKSRSLFDRFWKSDRGSSINASTLTNLPSPRSPNSKRAQRDTIPSFGNDFDVEHGTISSRLGMIAGSTELYERGITPSEESHARTMSGEEDVYDVLSRPALQIPDAVYSPPNLVRRDSYGFSTTQRGYGHRTRPSIARSEMSDDTICVSPTSLKGKGKHSRGDSLSGLLSGMASPTTPSSGHPKSPTTPLTATSVRSWDTMKPLPPTPGGSRPASQFTLLSAAPLAVDEQDEYLQAAMASSLDLQEPAAVYNQNTPPTITTSSSTIQRPTQDNQPARALPAAFIRHPLFESAEDGEASVYHTPAAEPRRLSVLSTSTIVDPQAVPIERIHSPTRLGSSHTTLTRSESTTRSPSSPKSKSTKSTTVTRL